MNVFALCLWLSVCLVEGGFPKGLRRTTEPTSSPSQFFIPIRFRTLSPTTLAPSSSPSFNAENFPVLTQITEFSQNSCEELQWSVTPTGVCLGSVEDCSLRLGLQAAKDACQAIGARLCTSNELSLFDAKQGCTIDHLRAWTSTPCRPFRNAIGVYAVSQAASSNYLAEVGMMCDMEERQQNVRCCADSHGKLPAVSPLLNQGASSRSSCAALDWDPLVSAFSAERNSTVCMEPCESMNHTDCDDPNESNCTIVSFQDAVTHCSEIGARLCNVGDIDSRSNCLSRGQVWTRSNCSQGMYVVGSTGVECVPATRRYWPLCCADTKDNALATNATNGAGGVVNRSCASLGWQAAGTNSSCVTDKVVQDSCRMNVDYIRSQSLCSDLGGRLCSPSEIRAGFAVLGDCAGNTSFVWSSQQGCSFSHAMAVGQSNQSCVPQLEQKVGLFCCADGAARPSTARPTSRPTSQPTSSPTQLPTLIPTTGSPTSPTSNAPSRTPRATGVQISPAPTAPTIVVTDAPTRAPTGTACDRYGWPTIKNMQDVCIETKVGGQCRAPDDWWAASTACESIGARLCTTAELFAHKKDKARQGCGSVRVWASDVCSKNVNNSASVDMDWPEFASRRDKKTRDPNKAHCDRKAASLQVACCAEALPPTPMLPLVSDPALEALSIQLQAPQFRSAKSCLELGWEPGRVSQVCAASRVYVAPTTPRNTKAPTRAAVTTPTASINATKAPSTSPPTSPPKLECSPLLSYTAAAQACASLQARLCTSWELAQGAAQNTGCQLDGVRVWTQTPCAFAPPSDNNNSSTVVPSTTTTTTPLVPSQTSLAPPPPQTTAIPTTNNAVTAVLTQGGANSDAVILLCKSITNSNTLPVRCCADV